MIQVPFLANFDHEGFMRCNMETSHFRITIMTDKYSEFFFSVHKTGASITQGGKGTTWLKEGHLPFYLFRRCNIRNTYKFNF